MIGAALYSRGRRHFFRTTMADLVLPATADQVVDLLDKNFPEASAELTWTDREVWFKAGQRAVVRWLQELRRRRDENLLESTDVLFNS